MNKTQKLNKLCGWLNDHNHTWYEPIPSKKTAWMPKGVRLITDDRRIAICVVEPDEEEETFKVLCKHHYSPLFIRESDTEAFLYEKMQNCLRGWTTATVKRMQAEKLKRKRVRVHRPVYEKVEPIKH